MENSLPWVEKYRPGKTDDIIGHGEIVRSLNKFIEKDALPHLLFFGPSGTGKTTTIKCCAKKIYGEYMDAMTLLLNASNERGIDVVRCKIKNFVSNQSNVFVPEDKRTSYKLVILDEIDSMTDEAQDMMKKLIEQNSAKTRFCLICNDIDKIKLALQSRCALYRFAPLSDNDMISRLKIICKEEKIKTVPGVVESIVTLSKGDMRTSINTLQHSSLVFSNNITVDGIHKIMGYCTPKLAGNIFEHLISLSNKKCTQKECTEYLYNLATDNNITIFNIVGEIAKFVLSSKMKLEAKIKIIKKLSECEKYEEVCIDQFMIIMIITSIFTLVK